MKSTAALCTLLAFMCLPNPAANAQLATEGLAPPVAPKIPKDVTVHGDKRVDDYFWLRDRSNPAVIGYLKAEDAYTDAVMAPNKALRDTLYSEMLGRIKETDSTAPYPDGAWLYYSRTEQGKQYRILCRKSRSDASSPEEVLVDLNALGEGLKFIGMGSFEVSDDGNTLAYSIDRNGHRDYELEVKDLRTGKTVAQPVGTASSFEWAADNTTIFYTKEDPVSKRSHLLGRCELPTGKNEILFEEKDVLFNIGLGKSLDRKYLFCESVSKLTSEVRALPADTPRGDWRVLAPRRDLHKYSADHREGLFYFVTNKDAKNYRVMTAPVATPDEAHWTEFLAADPNVKVNDITLFSGYAVVTERFGGLPHLKVIDLRTHESHEIAFPEPSYDADLYRNAVYDSGVLLFSYQSPVTAPSVFSYDMAKRERTLVKQTEVLGGYSPANYACERVYATASDGTQIPITLTYSRQLRVPGPQSLLLYGYGSYGISIDDTFSSSRLSLLDRGVIYATAHIRGGGEMGEPWREAGRMRNKMTTFTDFIACAEFLQRSGYTSPAK
ncbi:MAG TPA: prolyl oligopeptidase family serine peptidase, partial [Opitutaceae bacterium]